SFVERHWVPAFAGMTARVFSIASESAWALQQPLQIPLHRGPLAFDDAEHHGVAARAVRQELVIAQDAVLLRAQPLDRRARREIEEVGAELDRNALQRFAGMSQQQQLALGVDRRALCALRIPRMADFESPVRGLDVEV